MLRSEKERVLMLTSTNRSNVLGRLSVDSDVHEDVQGSGIPTPLQFDAFIPWVCAQWCASNNVLVTKMNQEDYVRQDIRKSRIFRRGRHKSAAPLVGDHHGSSGSDKVFEYGMHDRVVHMKTVYNNKRKLVEVSISGCPFKISRKIIHAFSLCISFHSAWNRLTFRRGGLSDEIIYEISKLLPHSHITELCFDDSSVCQGNYYILLEIEAQVKYLSLNRCKINDAVCAKIISCIDYGCPSSESLRILELASNDITDVGAKRIGTMLRKNRTLLHLNLSGNKITDKGFEAIIGSLKQFALTTQEQIDMKSRKIRYMQNRAIVYNRCLEELKQGKSEDGESTIGKKNIFSVKRMRRKSKRILDENLTAQAEIMTTAIVGDFKDPYCGDNVINQDGYIYSKGNLIFSSLNIAYNDLEYQSILKIRDVVTYQAEVEKVLPETGLIRITLDGNWMPPKCEELDVIDACLKKVISDLTPTPRKTRTSSLIRKLMSKTHTQ
ncbi:uncharacterized protein LOC113499152 [Trichoplusia ni]|nr:uncharacterized protein LOC113499152 [Trichoplusia ni]